LLKKSSSLSGKVTELISLFLPSLGISKMGLSKAQIVLIPWDPDSPEHVERLYQQRIACGWNKQAVEGWRVLQRAGKIALQWVVSPLFELSRDKQLTPLIKVLSESDPLITTKLSIHTSAWPAESMPISDTAASLGGKPRIPNLSRTFIPVGHISLDSENEDPNAADASRGIYRISSFYISTALQSSGLGRAAMDEIERLAVSEPLNAKTLTLGTVANEYEGKKEKWDAFREEGRVEPKVCFLW
jgi:hypothetical protein